MPAATLPPPSRSARRKGAGAGFTLPELVIAVALLAVLALLGLSVAGIVREKAAVAGCLNNLRQFGAAFQAYANDHSGYLPRSNYRSDGKIDSWQSALEGYVAQGERSIFICPAQRPPKGTCYALNQEFRVDAHQEKSLIRQLEIVSPSRYVVLSDSAGSSWITSGRREKMIEVNKLTARHDGIPNFLYADWHAEPFTRRLLGYSDAPADPFYQALWFARYQPTN